MRKPLELILKTEITPDSYKTLVDRLNEECQYQSNKETSSQKLFTSFCGAPGENQIFVCMHRLPLMQGCIRQVILSGTCYGLQEAGSSRTIVFPYTTEGWGCASARTEVMTLVLCNLLRKTSQLIGVARTVERVRLITCAARYIVHALMYVFELFGYIA